MQNTKPHHTSIHLLQALLGFINEVLTGPFRDESRNSLNAGMVTKCLGDITTNGRDLTL